MVKRFGTKLLEKGTSFCFFAEDALEGAIIVFDGEKEKRYPIQKEQNNHLWEITIEGLFPPFDYLIELKTPRGEFRLLDPFAKKISGPKEFGQKPRNLRSRFEKSAPFDWENSSRPKRPLSEWVIYEMHVRSFSKGWGKGSFEELERNLDRLEELGITAIELLPITEFDECHTHLKDSPLLNVWGYSPLSFFAIMERFAENDAILAFKSLVRAAHKRKIAVILDLVYNHTGESREFIRSWRGFAPKSYYLLDEEGEDLNFSGCGNTFYATHPISSEMIMESARYMAQEFQIDGIRLDLGLCLTRQEKGQNVELLFRMATDPFLEELTFFAEPWDAMGYAELGSFPSFDRFIVWNDRFRDATRRFINGFNDSTRLFAKSFLGHKKAFISHPLQTRASVHYVTSHDGFCLKDLVSYKEKHNEPNGENNLDGMKENYGVNLGCEGPSTDPEIEDRRKRKMRSYLFTLFFSRGIPMLWMGDELFFSRNGNNNPWNQDAPSWIPKEPLDQEFYAYVKSLLALRAKEPLFRIDRFFDGSEISYHGINPNDFGWYTEDHFIGIAIHPKELAHSYYFAFNHYEKKLPMTLPEGFEWELLFASSPCQELIDGDSALFFRALKKKSP